MCRRMSKSESTIVETGDHDTENKQFSEVVRVQVGIRKC